MTSAVATNDNSAVALFLENGTVSHSRKKIASVDWAKSVETANSTVERPQNLNQTSLDQGFGDQLSYDFLRTRHQTVVFASLQKSYQYLNKILDR